MVGTTAKGSKFFYYSCRNHLRRGSHGCGQKSINKAKLEEMVFTQLRNRILTEENISELVKLINKDLSAYKRDYSNLLKENDSRILKARESLQKLYYALETGKLDLDDLAPRIKELRSQISQLEQEKTKIESEANEPTLEINASEIGPYVEDLRGLLEKGTITKRKGFLKSFIKQIEYSHQKGGSIEYTIPLVKKPNNELSNIEVLPINQNGGVDGARTRFLAPDKQNFQMNQLLIPGF